MTNFYEEVYKLKTLLRKGWVMRNACEGRYESDAEHIFSCAMLALEVINRKNLQLNTEKVLKMILFHEIGEIDVGDLTPLDGVDKFDKYQKELECVERVAKECDMPEILELWLEFEANATPEAIFVKKLDKLDAILQSQIYSKQTNNPILFNEFFNTSKHIIADFEEFV